MGIRKSILRNNIQTNAIPQNDKDEGVLTNQVSLVGAVSFKKKARLLQ